MEPCVKVVEIDARGNARLKNPRLIYGEFIKEVAAPRDPKDVVDDIAHAIFDAGDELSSRERKDIIRSRCRVAYLYEDSNGKLGHKFWSPEKPADANAITYLVANVWDIQRKYDNTKFDWYRKGKSVDQGIFLRVFRSLYGQWVEDGGEVNMLFDAYVHDLNQYATGRMFTYVICSDWRIIGGGGDGLDYYYHPDDALDVGNRRLKEWFW